MMTNEEMLELAKKAGFDVDFVGGKIYNPHTMDEQELNDELAAYTSAIEEKYQAENARLLAANRDVKDWSDAAEADLKAAQAQIVMLRDALKELHKVSADVCDMVDYDLVDSGQWERFGPQVVSAEKTLWLIAHADTQQSSDAFIAEVKVEAQQEYADKLLIANSDYERAVRHAAMLANSWQNLYNDCGQLREVKLAYKNVERLIDDYKDLENFAIPELSNQAQAEGKEGK